MRTIHKYPVHDYGMRLELPIGAEFLAVQVQHGQPQAWFLLDPNEPKKTTRVFSVFGTGHEMSDAPRVYLGTFQLSGGALVFHLFEARVALTTVEKERDRLREALRDALNAQLLTKVTP
jgi:hypothetical protein